MFQVSEVIAKGAFGNVLRVQRGADKIAYAMKVAFNFIYFILELFWSSSCFFPPEGRDLFIH